MKKRLKKKGNYRILVLILVVLFIIFLLLLLLKCLLSSKTEIYSIESRTSNIIEAKKGDTENYETVAWIKVQGTNIDYPVLHTLNTESDYPVEREEYAWTFNNSEGKYYNKVNIFGHNIFNLGSSPKMTSETYHRFEELMNFVYYDFAKDNKYIQYTVGEKDYIYKIFSAGFLSSSIVDVFPKNKYTEKELVDNVKLLKEISIYDYDVDVDENDNVITVMTCTRFFGEDRGVDFLVSGRLLRDDEIMNNYYISKNSNYDEVEKTLKGSDEDEEV